MRTYHRESDHVIRVDTRLFPAKVDFADILDSVEVSPDEFADPPWDTCDGLEYTRKRDGSIELPWDSALETFYRDRGASKQVAKELTARSLAHRREYFAGVYAYGYEVWQVCCDFQGFSASVCGVDDYTYATREVAEEIALEVVGEMQSAGFEVVNLPDRAHTYRENRRENRRDSLRRNVHLFDNS